MANDKTPPSNGSDHEGKVFDLHEGGAPIEGAQDLVTEVGQQLTRFLDESQSSIDEFFKGIRKSADQALDIADDHRLQSFMVVLLAGAAVGAFAAGALARSKRAERAA